jgi:acyl dehydratase
VISDEYGALCVGQRKRSPGRTITETDVVHFCMLTGNWLGLHADAEYARGTRYGRRVAQGSLVFSIANAMIPFDADVVEAFVGVDALRFHHPTFIGDTIHAASEIVALEDRGAKGGVATMLLQAVNQREEVAMSCRFSLFVRRERRAAPGESRAHAGEAR